VATRRRTVPAVLPAAVLVLAADRPVADPVARRRAGRGLHRSPRTGPRGAAGRL